MSALLEDPSYFDFPLTTSVAAPQVPARISLDDVGRLSEVARGVKSVITTFGKEACEILCLGDRIRVHIVPATDANTSLISQSPNVAELITLTAKELKVNAAKQSPEPHTKALTSQLVVGILRAVAADDPLKHAAPTFSDGSGTHAIPVLEPTAFVQPAPSRERSLSGTMRVHGARCAKKNAIIFMLSEDCIPVSIDPDLQAEALKLPIAAIREGIWFTGTILQDPAGEWSTVPGGKLTLQRGL